jgi:hypothetical protein
MMRKGGHGDGESKAAVMAPGFKSLTPAAFSAIARRD